MKRTVLVLTLVIAFCAVGCNRRSDHAMQEQAPPMIEKIETEAGTVMFVLYPDKKFRTFVIAKDGTVTQPQYETDHQWRTVN
jgi:hypothetical protein